MHITLVVFLCITLLIADCLNNPPKDTQLPEDEEDPGADEEENPIPEDDNPKPDDEKNPEKESPDPDVIEEPDSVPENWESSLVIFSDIDDYRTYTLLNFSLSDTPSQPNITWDMGDGGIQYGKEIQHFYRNSSYFQIIVSVIWEGEITNVDLTIPVKNKDSYVVGSTGSENWLIGKRRPSLGFSVLGGISIPKATVTLDLYDLVGELEVGVSISIDNEDGPDEEIEILESETVTGYWTDHSFSWEIPTEVFAGHEQNLPYSLTCFIEMQNNIEHVETTTGIYIFY